MAQDISINTLECQEAISRMRRALTEAEDVISTIQGIPSAVPKWRGNRRKQFNAIHAANLPKLRATVTQVEELIKQMNDTMIALMRADGAGV